MYLHEASYGCSSALVSRHACHHSPSLDVSSASVVRHSLAYQQESVLHWTWRLVGQIDDTALVSLYHCKYGNPLSSKTFQNLYNVMVLLKSQT